jgi:hypothetical protein
MKSDVYLPLIAFHHSVGLAVGIPVNMYFMQHSHFRLFGLVLLGAPSLCCATSVFCRTFDLEKHHYIEIFNSAQMTVGFCLGQRCLYFFPAAYLCVKTVFEQESSWWIRAPFLYGVTAMSAFNLIVLAIMGAGLKKVLLADTPEKKQEGKRLVRRGSSMGLSVGEFAKVVPQRRGLTNVFVAAKMVGLAERAKRKVSDRKRSGECADKHKDS